MGDAGRSFSVAHLDMLYSDSRGTHARGVKWPREPGSLLHRPSNCRSLRLEALLRKALGCTLVADQATRIYVGG